jgi:hypothetical protein
LEEGYCELQNANFKLEDEELRDTTLGVAVAKVAKALGNVT